MSYGAIEGSVGAENWISDEELVTAWMMGPAPMVSVCWPVAWVQATPLMGLQTPMTTVPPGVTAVGEKGNRLSAAAGTVMERMMVEGSLTNQETLVSAVNALLTAFGATIPTVVRFVLSAPVMNPVPPRVTVKVVIGVGRAVGMLAGVNPLAVAPGEMTVILKVTTMVETGLP